VAHQARRLIARMPGKWHMVIIAALQARLWAAFNMVAVVAYTRAQLSFTCSQVHFTVCVQGSRILSTSCDYLTRHNLFQLLLRLRACAPCKGWDGGASLRNQNVALTSAHQLLACQSFAEPHGRGLLGS
jgi:hypothetical protein